MTKEQTLATAIIENMNAIDRATYARTKWVNGVSGMCLDGEDLGAVLDYIDAAMAVSITITMFLQDDDSLGTFDGDRAEFERFAAHYCEATEARVQADYPAARVSVDWTEGPGDCNVAYCATDDEAADNTIGDEIKATIGDDFDAAWETF